MESFPGRRAALKRGCIVMCSGGGGSWVGVDVGLVVTSLVLSGNSVFLIQEIFKNVWVGFFSVFDIKL